MSRTSFFLLSATFRFFTHCHSCWDIPSLAEAMISQPYAVLTKIKTSSVESCHLPLMVLHWLMAILVTLEKGCEPRRKTFTKA